jgi:hypothetical protein
LDEKLLQVHLQKSGLRVMRRDGQLIFSMILVDNMGAPSTNAGRPNFIEAAYKLEPIYCGDMNYNNQTGRPEQMEYAEPPSLLPSIGPVPPRLHSGSPRVHDSDFHANG